jgi:hypothetical protein
MGSGLTPLGGWGMGSVAYSSLRGMSNCPKRSDLKGTTCRPHSPLIILHAADWKHLQLRNSRRDLIVLGKTSLIRFRISLLL